MAVLTSKFIAEELNQRLSEFTQFGMILNYMLDEKRIDMKDLKEIFLEKNQEKAIFLYSNVLKKIDNNDMELSFNLYSKKYPNIGELDSNDYYMYLNNQCIDNILRSLLKEGSQLDVTYINTYSYLLETNFNYRK